MLIGLSVYINILATNKIQLEKNLEYSGNYFGYGLLLAAVFIISVSWQTAYPKLSVLITYVVVAILFVLLYITLNVIYNKMDRDKSKPKDNNINIHCNYLKPDTYLCLINPQLEYNLEKQAINEYCKTNNFVNCPRIKVLQSTE